MNDNENLKNTEEKKEPKKPAKKPQRQSLLETLGLTPKDQEEIEKKLFLVKYFDFISEQTFNLIYKNKFFEKYTEEFTKRIETLGDYREEDKLLKIGFKDKKIIEIIYRLKERAEEIAANNGVTRPIEKRLQKLNFLVIIPIFGITIALMIIQLLLGVDLMLFAFPLLCVGCFAPNIIKGSLLRKMYNSQEEHKNELYTENREDLVVLKGYINEILENIRSSLLEKEIPLQIIKFQLLSGDYGSIQIIQQQVMRGMLGQKQYLVCFEYPQGMEPFPIPEQWQQKYPVPGQKKIEKREKNFILLSELKAKDGIIESFVPYLKESLADKINEMLNDCEFKESTEKIEKILPNYSPEMPIYCTCGEISELKNVQICNWNKQFNFYLIVGKPCKCGESIYAISLMDDNDEIPDELKEIFTT